MAPLPLSAADVVRLLGLALHPEGGHFRETFRDTAPADRRATSTAIYFLLARGERSRWHRIDAVEVWHCYAGAPLVLRIAEAGGVDRAARCRSWRRRAAAGDRAGGRMASRGIARRLDARRLHGRAGIRIQDFRACPGGLGSAGLNFGLRRSMSLAASNPPPAISAALSASVALGSAKPASTRNSVESTGAA